MGCSSSTDSKSSGAPAGSSTPASPADVLVKRALNAAGNSNAATVGVLLHCAEIQSLLKEKALRDREGIEDSSDEALQHCELDRTSEEYIKKKLHTIVSLAKTCQGKQEFLRSSCHSEMLIISNMLRRSFPKTAASLKFVLKVALDLVEKNLEVDRDSVSDRIHNLTPFSSRTNLSGVGEPVPPGASFSTSTTQVIQEAPLASAMSASTWTSLTSKSRHADLTSSHHGSTSSLEDFGFYDISTHSVKGEKRDAQAQQAGFVQTQLSKAIASGVLAGASSGKMSTLSEGDELAARSHG